MFIHKYIKFITARSSTIHFSHGRFQYVNCSDELSFFIFRYTPYSISNSLILSSLLSWKKGHSSIQTSAWSGQIIVFLLRPAASQNPCALPAHRPSQYQHACFLIGQSYRHSNAGLQDRHWGDCLPLPIPADSRLSRCKNSPGCSSVKPHPVRRPFNRSWIVHTTIQPHSLYRSFILSYFRERANARTRWLKKSFSLNDVKPELHTRTSPPYPPWPIPFMTRS